MSLGDRSIVDFTLEKLSSCSRVTDILVSSDSNHLLKYSRDKFDVICHKRSMSTRSLELEELLLKIVRDLPTTNDYTHILMAWINYPFRAKNLFDRVIDALSSCESDSIFCVYPEYNTYWHGEQDGLKRVTPNNSFFRENRDPVYRDLRGLCTITSIANILKGRILGPKPALFRVQDLACTLNTHDFQGLSLAKLIVDKVQDLDLDSSDNFEKFGGKEIVHNSHYSKTILVANRDIEAGKYLSADDLALSLGDHGLSESMKEAVISKKTLYSIKAGDPITFGIFEC